MHERPQQPVDSHVKHDINTTEQIEHVLLVEHEHLQRHEILQQHVLIVHDYLIMQNGQAHELLQQAVIGNVKHDFIKMEINVIQFDVKWIDLHIQQLQLQIHLIRIIALRLWIEICEQHQMI